MCFEQLNRMGLPGEYRLIPPAVNFDSRFSDWLGSAKILPIFQAGLIKEEKRS
jgi:hypothetical protein